MHNMRQHLAVQGDCWDLLSWRLYQDEGFAHILLESNPALRGIVQFDEPVLINVPDLPPVRSQTSDLLPPWKQE